MILPLGGSILKYWVNYQYLNKINCKEVHIYDNDVKQYQQSIDKINQRADGSWGVLTKKYEIENYLNSKAIKQIYNVDINAEEPDLPNRFAKAYFEKNKKGAPWTASQAKKRLSKVFTDAMTCDLLEEIDPNGEVKGWFDRITKILH